MINSRELCWLTTTKCNQHCKYCHRFADKKDLNNEEYMQIISKLADYGVKELTLGGGEALLVDNIVDIINFATRFDIKLKLVTNGILLLKESNLPILNQLSKITLSIDSTVDQTNEILGRGVHHYENIKKVLNSISQLDNPPEVNINSVANKFNLGDFYNLSQFIKQYKTISHWRIFRFCPLRDSALKNREMFEISNNEFLTIQNNVVNLDLPFSIDFRNYEDMGKKYLLITPDGNLCISNNLQDEVVGNMLYEDLSSFFTNNKS